MIGTLRRLLAGRYRRHRRLRPWPFCWRVTIEGLVVTLLVAIPMGLLGFDREVEDVDDFMFSAVFLAPWLETLLLQAAPIGIARFCRAGVAGQTLTSLAVFFLAHVSAGLGTALAAGLVGGFYFAFTYVFWRRAAWWTAFWVTAVSHFLHNAFAVVLWAMGL